MPGLDYGSGFRKRNIYIHEKRIEGVVYMPPVKKWLVRIKHGPIIKTMAAFDTEKEAIEYYTNIKNPVPDNNV